MGVHGQTYELESGPDQVRGQLRKPRLASPALGHLLPVVSVLWLGTVLNVRFPKGEASLWYLVPSVDLVLLIGVYAVLAAAGRRVPRSVHGLLVLFVLAVRCLRFADGVKLRYFNREFNAYIDLPLLPELVRLLKTTLSSVEFWSLVVVAPVAAAALAVSVSHALRHVERGVSRSGVRRTLAFGFAFLLAASPVWPQGRHPEYYSGAFGASAWPRFLRELSFTAQVPDRVRRVESELSKLRNTLPAEGSGARGLERQNVLVFLIESYGEAVLDRPVFREQSAPLLAELDGRLARAGFHRASAILESPTYGGGSWLAHATLATGVRVDNQLDYELLASRRPSTVADWFERSGYRTVSVQPGTTREVLNNDFLGFDRSYYAWSFGYRGPSFAWAPMPDQFVLDFVRRRELESAEKPLFALFVLVSSHAPWTAIPPVIDDWSALGDGSVYHRLEPVRSSSDWADLESASPAYFASVRYDLEVLTRFLIDFVKDDGLVLWLGDHQPAADVTGGSPKRGVPVHVITRRADFLAPFSKRGYVRGLDPTGTRARLPMESLLVSLIRDFAGEERAH